MAVRVALFHALQRSRARFPVCRFFFNVSPISAISAGPQPVIVKHVAGLPQMPSLLDMPSLIANGVFNGQHDHPQPQRASPGRLRVRAAQHGRSMEDEARSILRIALSVEAESGQGLVAAVRARIEPLGGVELELPHREAICRPPDLTK